MLHVKVGSCGRDVYSGSRSFLLFASRCQGLLTGTCCYLGTKKALWAFVISGKIVSDGRVRTFQS